MNNTKDNMTRIIHWVSAILLLFLIGLGFYMTISEFDAYNFYLHKSLGVVAFIFIIIRLYWRKKQAWKSSSAGSSQEKLVSFVHKLLLVLFILMPISGFLNSGFGGYGIYLFDLDIIPKNHDAEGNYLAFNQFLSNAGRLIHEIIAYAFTALVVLHIVASLKHHFIDKDNTLNRMLNRNDQ